MRKQASSNPSFALVSGVGGLAGRLTGFLGFESTGDRLEFALSGRIGGWMGGVGWLVSLWLFLDRLWTCWTLSVGTRRVFRVRGLWMFLQGPRLLSDVEWLGFWCVMSSTFTSQRPVLRWAESSKSSRQLLPSARILPGCVTIKAIKLKTKPPATQLTSLSAASIARDEVRSPYAGQGVMLVLIRRLHQSRHCTRTSAALLLGRYLPDAFAMERTAPPLQHLGQLADIVHEARCAISCDVSRGKNPKS